jgi:hypothetical protein
MVCQIGASWVRQHILNAHPHAKLSVIAIFEPMLGDDSRSAIDRNVLDDPRVISLWDPRRISGSWFADHPLAGLGGGGGYVVWDAYYAFNPSATWQHPEPTGAVAAGSVIIGNTPGLLHHFVPLLS